ncbi:hypothetical protein [Bacillus rubiinfantis]|uniref:hypothetical protein n=1 Tax=Bacillus rubiinfantis TaxID=1499680 RepID=UPI0005A9669F|nr:hypothetical protein [Bacillus rubiinfantis]
MTHYFTFSIIGGHIKNAEKEVHSMFETEGIKIKDEIYGEKEEKIFEENICHGLLALYSLNAALESLVAFLADRLGVNSKFDIEKQRNKFYLRIDKLKIGKIITDDLSLSTCLKLRKYRNIVTHWEENLSYLYGSNSYIPFMFGFTKPKSDIEKLIGNFNRSHLEDCLEAFNRLLDNIINNIEVMDHEYISFQLECMKRGSLIFE